jgi:hypothetical protein
VERLRTALTRQVTDTMTRKATPLLEDILGAVCGCGDMAVCLFVMVRGVIAVCCLNGEGDAMQCNVLVWRDGRSALEDSESLAFKGKATSPHEYISLPACCCRCRLFRRALLTPRPSLRAMQGCRELCFKDVVAREAEVETESGAIHKSRK